MIHFITHEAHMAEQVNDVKAPWLRFPVPGLTTKERDLLADHLALKLGWFTWFTEEDAK